MHLPLAVEQRLGRMLRKIKVGKDIEIYILSIVALESSTNRCETQSYATYHIKDKHSVNLAKAKQMADHRARSEITKRRISMTNAEI